MAFLVSPGVEVKETDLTNIIPAVATTIGGFAGIFEWGPCLEATTVSSEADLISKFGYPRVSSTAASNSRDDWYCAANYLGYSNNLVNVRILPDDAVNATSEPSGGTSTTVLENFNDFLVKKSGLSTDGTVYARYPGELGNGIGIALIDAGLNDSDFSNAVIVGSNTAESLFTNRPISSVWATDNIGNAGLLDEVHVVVYTTNTQLTGTSNQILETYEFLSKAKNGKTADGASSYYVDVVNNNSKYVYLVPETTVAGTGPAIGATITGSTDSEFRSFTTNVGVPGIRQYSLSAGLNGTTVSDENYTAGYALLNDVESVDVSLLITGSAGIDSGETSKVVQKYVIDIADTRKDCIAFVSPDYASAVSNPTSDKVVDYFNTGAEAFNSTSYAFFDSGWKRQYDRYNDEYFWAPLNPDIAGLVARTEQTNDAWWSPAGLNRGFIQNVVKLSFNPNQTDRDKLYSYRINPVVTFRGQGTLLYGDKTALSRPSAFDRINVRRLFIVLEKAIATASKFQLFEFNDDFTRRIFVNAVEPFLNDVRTRRGITDFTVICDESNNTGEVIDANRFVADIYIKPTRSINFITLNFIAVRTGVEFNEVVGG